MSNGQFIVKVRLTHFLRISARHMEQGNNNYDLKCFMLVSSSSVGVVAVSLEQMIHVL